MGRVENEIFNSKQLIFGNYTFDFVDFLLPVIRHL